jgi:hypothetical protein
MQLGEKDGNNEDACELENEDDMRPVSGTAAEGASSYDKGVLGTVKEPEATSTVISEALIFTFILYLL